MISQAFKMDLLKFGCGPRIEKWLIARFPAPQEALMNLGFLPDKISDFPVDSALRLLSECQMRIEPRLCHCHPPRHQKNVYKRHVVTSFGVRQYALHACVALA